MQTLWLGQVLLFNLKKEKTLTLHVYLKRIRTTLGMGQSTYCVCTTKGYEINKTSSGCVLRHCFVFAKDIMLDICVFIEGMVALIRAPYMHCDSVAV